MGFILFLTAVMTEEKMAGLRAISGTYWVADQENSVMFEGDDKYELALRIKDYILELNPHVIIL